MNDAIMFVVGVMAGFIVGLGFSFDQFYERGAVAATNSEVVCKNVEQFDREPEWQCVDKEDAK